MPFLDENIESYQRLVDASARSKSLDILPNAGPTHAAIAMSKLFDETSKNVKMIVGSFSGPVCDQENYLKSLKNCVDKDVDFKIIFIDKRNEASKAYQLLVQAQKDGKNIKFKNASKEFVTQLSKGDQKLKHFAVFDNDKFRFETDKDKFVAWFSFNDKKNAEILSGIFDAEFPN